MDFIRALCLLSCTVLVSGHGTRNFDLNTCRVQLLCGVQDHGTGPGSVVTRPGKRGPAGPRGPPGLNGQSCECSGRLSEIESRLKSLERKKCPQTKFHFSSKQTTDWIRVKHPIPEFTAATVCAWLTPKTGASLTGSYLSYATSTQPNEFLLYMDNAFHVFISAADHSTPLVVSSRTHVCVAISTTRGWVKIFQNGILNANLNFRGRNPVAGGGALLIGQEQDAFVGNFVAGESTTGTVENFMMWFRVLDHNEIRSLYNDHCSCPDGYDIALTPDMIQFEGKVESLPMDQC